MTLRPLWSARETSVAVRVRKGEGGGGVAGCQALAHGWCSSSRAHCVRAGFTGTSLDGVPRSAESGELTDCPHGLDNGMDIGRSDGGSAVSDGRTPAQIEADIVRRRQDLAATLNEIGVRVHPKTIVGEAQDSVRQAVDRTAGRAYVAVNRAVSDLRARAGLGGRRPADGAHRAGRGRGGDPGRRGGRALLAAQAQVAFAARANGGEYAARARAFGTAVPEPVPRGGRTPGNVVPVSSNTPIGTQDNTHDKLPIRMLHDRVLVRTDIPRGRAALHRRHPHPGDRRRRPPAGLGRGGRGGPERPHRGGRVTGCCTTRRTAPRWRCAASPTC